MIFACGAVLLADAPAMATADHARHVPLAADRACLVAVDGHKLTAMPVLSHLFALLQERGFEIRFHRYSKPPTMQRRISSATPMP